MEFFSSQYEYTAPLAHQPLSYYGEKIRSLGQGAYGVVDAYGDVPLGKHFYAIKTIISQGRSSGSPSLPDRSTLTEISILRRTQHPNIVRLLDVITKYDSARSLLEISLVQPLAKYDLHTAISRESLGTKDKDLIVYQILCGVAYLQSRHIIHGDIKPANILFYSLDDVRIADFGLSVINACNTRSEWPGILYSVWYRAPEILLSNVPRYSLPADTWATAAVIWEFYTRSPLFAGIDEKAVMNKIISRLGTPGVPDNWPEARSYNLYPSLINLSIPPKRPYPDYFYQGLTSRTMADIIVKMLVYNPNDRLSPYDALADPYFDSARASLSGRQADNESQMLDCPHSHETRDRYPSNYLRRIGLTTKELDLALERMAYLALKFRAKAKTVMTGVQIFDEYLSKCRDHCRLPYLHLAIASFSLAYTIVENALVRASTISESKLIDELRIEISQTLDYDFFFTVPDDYRDEFFNYGLTASQSQLATAYMLVTALRGSGLKFELLPHDIFNLAVALVLDGEDEPIPAGLKRLLNKYGDQFWDEFTQLGTKSEEYFDWIADPLFEGTYEAVLFTLEEMRAQ